MKHLLLILLLPLKLFSQDTTTNKLEFSLIDSVSASKKELLGFSKAWLTKTFVSSKAVIEMEDADAGKIIGKAIFKLSDGTTSAHFIITIDTKDNKYRCVLSEFTRYVLYKGESKPTVNGGSFTKIEETGMMKNSINKKTNEVRDETEAKANSLLSDLKVYMKTAKEKSNF